MDTLSTRLAAARAEARLTQTELARAAGLKNQSIVGSLESGHRKNSSHTPALAAALGVNALWLAEGRGPKRPADAPTPPEPSNVSAAPLGARRIPLISYVQAGHMREAIDPYQVGDAADWLLTDLDLSANAFALRIKGDSMLPDFREGDTVVIDPAVEPIPGDYVVAKNGENEATFKKYRPRGVNERGDAVFELVPLNEDYPSMRSDITPIRIIGTMVEHRRYRRR